MEIDIPEKQVLLSEFEEWHFVLSNSYLAPATNYEEYQRLNDWFESLTPEKQQRVKEKSWQQIFDITIRRQDEWTMNGEIVQGCFWQLKIDQVRKVLQSNQFHKFKIDFCEQILKQKPATT